MKIVYLNLDLLWHAQGSFDFFYLEMDSTKLRGSAILPVYESVCDIRAIQFFSIDNSLKNT